MIGHVARTFVAASLAATAVVAHERTTTKISWTREIGPLVRARCASCHRPDGRAPMSLVGYADARPWARAIKEEVLARRMPKWHAARGYGDFVNDPSLSQFEIALIVAWVDGGAPKDPPRNTPALELIPPLLTLRDAGPPAAAREIAVPCNTQPLPPGEVLAVRPQLARGGAAGISVLLPGGRREVVAWIRNFDPAFAETYWLRSPIPQRPDRRLMVEATAPCTLTLIMQ